MVAAYHILFGHTHLMEQMKKKSEKLDAVSKSQKMRKNLPTSYNTKVILCFIMLNKNLNEEVREQQR